MRSRIDRAIERIAFWTAMLGGAVLIVVLTLTVISIIGRGFVFAGLGPIPGDFELVEAGTAFAVFSFLPLCQFHRGHVTVDIFLSRAGRRPNAAIDVISNALMTAAAAVLTWRLYDGMLDKRSYSETTFILQFPVWWGYAASLLGACVFTLVCAYTVARSLQEARESRTTRKISER